MTLNKPVPGVWMRSIAQILFAFCCLSFIAIRSALGAPYPKEGMPIEWLQPDGTRLALRVFGDEFYAFTATEDGYTVIFESGDKSYYYAMMGADGESFISSKVEAGKIPPVNLPKHLEESPKVVAAKRAQNIERCAPDRSADWAARKKAVQAARDAASPPPALPVSDDLKKTSACPTNKP